jgi:hypothetical protein
MEIRELIEILNNTDVEEAPIQAIQELIERKDESVPVLLDLAKGVLRDYKRVNCDRLDYIIALYILAYFKEAAVFPYLVKFALLPSEWAEKLLGNHLVTGLGICMVSTFDGDLQSIKHLIENETAHIWSRALGMRCLNALYVTGILKRKEVIDYYKYLLESDLAYDYEFSTLIILNIINIHAGELYTEIINLLDRGLVYSGLIDKSKIDDNISMSQEECIKTYLENGEFCVPIQSVDDIVDRVEFEYGEESEEEEELDDEYDDEDEDFSDSSKFSGAKKISRNAPCPCGSEKKYKKCGLLGICA